MENKLTYNEFIESKKHTSINFGINPKWFPNNMFDFQKYICDYAIKKGRCAIFLDTGLGKTLIELTIAVNYRNETKKVILNRLF